MKISYEFLKKKNQLQVFYVFLKILGLQWQSVTLGRYATGWKGCVAHNGQIGHVRTGPIKQLKYQSYSPIHDHVTSLGRKMCRALLLVV